MSPDIEKGKRWNGEISDRLEECQVGIICLTKENLGSPWLCFEAGALSKNKTAYTCTFLIDVSPSNVEFPLATFQHTLAEKKDVRKLLDTINEAARQQGDRPLVSEVLTKVFERSWPEFEAIANQVWEATGKRRRLCRGSRGRCFGRGPRAA